MAKTVFTDGDPSLGILGTRVLAAFLNKIFNHKHDGLDQDGSVSKISLSELEDAIALRLAPTGMIIYTAAAEAPAGYLKANGALVSRVTYATLFATIGTTYGIGDGATTFALPDLRGEFIRGLDDGRGVDAGRALGSAQADSFKSHNHAWSMPGSPNNENETIDYIAAGQAANWLTFNVATSSTGGSETRPRNIALLPCIKY
jgi:microcystin-dependent protein